MRWPCVPSASTVTWATRSEPGSKLPSSLALAAAALVAGAHADDAAVRRRAASPPRSRAGSSRRPPRRARRASGRAARARRSSCRGSASAAAAGSAAPRVAREDVDRTRSCDRAVRSACSSMPVALPNSRRSARGSTTAPERRCEPGCLPFSTRATGTSPSRSATSGCSSSSWPRRIAQARPAGPGADDEHADLDPLVDRVGRLGDELARGERRREVRRAVAISRVRWRSELGQLGDDLVHVADDAEVAELEDRRVRVLVDRDDRASELCMPTLCWIAPEMPSAT